jgi:diaminopimelate decarboxylase
MTEEPPMHDARTDLGVDLEASATDVWAIGSRGERPRFDPRLLERLAHEHGTPLYVYDLDHVVGRLSRLAGFDAVRYAQKANTNLALLRRLARAGAVRESRVAVRVDAVSAGELMRARAAGFTERDIQVTGDGFDRELAALVAGAGPELDVSAGSLDALEHALELGRRRLTLRVNPGFGAGHHAKVTTGGPGTKHGIWFTEIPRAVELAHAAGATVTALHMHVGSGATQERLAEMLEFTGDALRSLGRHVERVSMGGGLPIPYHPTGVPFDPTPLVAAWREARDGWVRARGGQPLEIEVEPGRYLVAHAGVLITEVLGVNRTPNYTFTLVDAGFHTLVRPAMYGAYHHVSALTVRHPGPDSPQVLAGPLCETSDLLTQTRTGDPDPRPLPPLSRGDLVLIHDVGAYGAAMSSGYNNRPLPAEVVIEGGRATLARPREDLAARIAEEARRLAGG